MNPQIETLKLPPTLRLVPRNAPPNSDERPLVRNAAGHVLASVEVWRPDLAN